MKFTQSDIFTGNAGCIFLMKIFKPVPIRPMKKKLDCIMIVDDDVANNFYCEILINEANCALQVKTKFSVTTAFDYLIESNSVIDENCDPPFPDLIFLDINMPFNDGWDFITSYSRIKSSLLKEPVIIMISSSVNPNDKLKALGTSVVSEFYTKPMTPKIIDEVMAKYFAEYL